MSMEIPDWLHENDNMSAKLTPKDWEFHRLTIEQLYSVEKHPLKTVQTIMAEQHDFHATERMYKARLRIWRVRKNCTTKEMVRVIKIINDRAESGKDTGIRVRGMEIDATKLRKFRNRKRQTEKEILMEASTRSSTPSDISFFTPQGSPKPTPVEDNNRGPISRRASARVSVDVPAMSYIGLAPSQINTDAFIDFPSVDVNDPQTLLAQEMSSITNAYFESYFRSKLWTSYSVLSIDFDGDEIVDVANLNYSSKIDANTAIFDFTNPGTLVTLYEVACLLFKRGNSQAAERLIEQGKNLIEKFLENEHPQLLGCLFLVVCTLEAKERMDLLTGLLDFAQWKAVTVRGPTHPVSRMISCCSRASTSRQLGAPRALEGLVDTFERLIGDSHIFTLRLRQLHAWSLLQQGRLDATLSELQKLQQAYKSLAGDDHLHSRHALFEIAQIYTTQGKLKEAEEGFLQVYSLSEQKFGRDPPLMINFECMRMLAVIYRRQENREKVLSTLCHTLPLGVKIMGEEHPTVLLIRHDLKKMLG